MGNASPVDVLLSRLDGVRRSGKGHVARCPAHKDRSASLSVAEGNDGRALVKCFAGCSMLDVLHAVGLEVADLFPPRETPQGSDAAPASAHERRFAFRVAGWKAALPVLEFEATVVLVLARRVVSGEPLSVDDCTRAQLAVDRISDARHTLSDTATFRPQPA